MINNYHFSRWLNCGNEDRLDSWATPYVYTYDHYGSKQFNDDMESKAKENEAENPCVTRLATAEEIKAIFG